MVFLLPDKSLSPIPPIFFLKLSAPPLNPAILAPIEFRLPLNLRASFASCFLSFYSGSTFLNFT